MSRESVKSNQSRETEESFEKAERESTQEAPRYSLQEATPIASYIPLLILALVSFATYFNALSGDFVFDDQSQLVANPWIRNISNIPTVFSKSVWSFQSAPVVSNYYRPLMHCAYILTYQLFGLKPLGFHLVNVLLHCGVTVLVFLTIRRFLPEHGHKPAYLSAPFIAALLFASHPIHTEAVTWIAGLPDVAFTFFYLLSFYLYTKSKSLVSGSQLFSLLCFAVAAFFKEPALTLPAILFVYDFTCRQQRPGWPECAKRYIPYLAIGAGYLALRIHALGAFAPQRRYTFLSPYQYAINVFPLFSKYIQKLIFPTNLNAFYVFHPVTSLLEWKALLSISVTAVVIVLAVVTFKKNKPAFLSISLLVVPLLPVLYIPALGENTFTERYLYLPSVGYVFLLALFLSWTERKFPNGANFIAAAFILMAGTYALGTVNRNRVWQSEYNLWVDTVQKSPDSPNAHILLGNIYKDRDMPDKAIEQFQAATSLQPESFASHVNLAAVYMARGLDDKAMGELQIAAAANPTNDAVNADLGVLYYKAGKMEGALRCYRKAADQGLAFAQNKLALMYYRGEGTTKDDSEALRWMQKAGSQNNPEALANLGFMYERGLGLTKNLAAAAYWYEKANQQGNHDAAKPLADLRKMGVEPHPPDSPRFPE